jgi:peptidoglycan/xylan/chitin deacetylase (PgdA/CDA1 family)
MRGAVPYRRDGAHGLMFHRFHASPAADAWQGALTPEEFEAVLVHAGLDRILRADEWMSRLAEGRLGPADLCITFDDGLKSQADYALPVLERHGLTAFWFVYSSVFEGRPVRSEIYSYVAGRIGGMPVMIAEFLERCPGDVLAQLESPAYRDYVAGIRPVFPFYSDGDLRYRFLRNNPANEVVVAAVMQQILEAHGFAEAAIARTLWLRQADVAALAAAGHNIGLHSYDHPLAMAALGADEQREQYRRNARDLASVTGVTPDAMSHPLNSYNEDSLAILAALGVRCGFRSNMAETARPWPRSRLEFPREDPVTILSMIHKEPGR